MKKSYILFIFIFLLSHKSYAENFIAATANWSPYAMITEKGISGISVDVLNEIVKRTGDTVSINLYPAKRLNKLFDLNKLDINFADSPDWNIISKNPKYVFSENYINVKEYVYFLKDRYIDLKSPIDLKGKNIAISAGYYYAMFEKFFNKGSITKIELNSNKSLLRFLKMGRCDAALFDNILFDFLLVELKYDKRKFKRGLEINNAPLGLKIRIEKKNALNRINKAIKMLKKEGFIKKTISKYIKQNYN